MILARSWLGQIGWNVFLSTIPPYTWMHLHFRVPVRIPVTLSEHYMSHSARFKNTMIELKRLQKIHKSQRELMPWNNCFCRKRLQFPVAVPASKNACLLNPRSWPGWTGICWFNSPPGHHLVKCVLNTVQVKSPLPSAMPWGSWGPGFQLTDTLIIAHHN